MKKKKYIGLVIFIASILFCNKIKAVTEYIVCEYVDDNKQALTMHVEMNRAYEGNKEKVKVEYNGEKFDIGLERRGDTTVVCPPELWLKTDHTRFTDGAVSTIGDNYVYFTYTRDYNIKTTDKVSCGSVTSIPKKFPELTSMFMTIIQIAVPVVLVIMGSMDLFKSIIAQKDDEIKKGQQIFVKRLIVAAMIFFVFVVTKLLVSVLADSVEESNDIVECMDCFLNGEENCEFEFEGV